MKRAIILTSIIGAYSIFMAVYFGRDLLRDGQSLRFWLTVGAEAVVLVLLFFALKRRARYRRNRKNDR